MSELTEYETICVFTPETQGEKMDAVSEKIQKIFSQHKVKEVAKDDWGQP